MPEVSRNALARSNITACHRCRRRKQRCDQRLPKCKSCEKAGVECVSIDAVTQRFIPRSYVHSLEERVAFLENKLLQNGIRDYENEETAQITTHTQLHESAAPQSRPDDAIGHGQQASEIIQSLSGKLGLECQTDQSFTSSLLRQLYRAEAMRDGLPQDLEDTTFSFPSQHLDVSPAEFPRPAVVEHLVKVFFELANFSTPILHEVTFREHLAIASNAETAERNPKASFFSFIVFAIALLTIQKHDSTNVSTTLCERYFASALHSLDPIGLPADLEGVQALLLIALYSYLHPRAFDPWRTIGMALRLAVGIGLHKDLPADKTDALTLDTRRRVFWVAYSMDRTVGTLLRRPFSLSDGAIECQLPSAVEDEYIRKEGIAEGPVGIKAFGLHYFQYRQLQSEIQVMLYEKLPPTFPTLDFPAWQRHMHEILSQWLSTQPAASSNSNIAPPEALQLAYHQAVILLYRPSPAIPQPSEAALLILSDSASRIIHLYRRLHRENKLRLFWQAVHNLFAAGTALLHCYSHSAEMRERTSLRSLESSIHACSAVLWAMVERFPAAKGKRDAFDVIATAALDSLSTDGPPSDIASGGSRPGDGTLAMVGTPSSHGGQGHRDSTGQPPAVFGNDQLVLGFSPWTGNIDESLTSQAAGIDELSLDPTLFQNNIGIATWI